ncbi:MAG: exodeoxyribonuclease VII small subunit [Candidatus Omnitrophota bacterium]|jgi:exodeoxyribonuclease VII small subunit
MKDISFEKALEKLEKIVEDLEAGDLSLDDSLKKYEEGIKLVRVCQQKLGNAKERIELLSKDEKGKFKKKAFREKSEEE